MSCKIEGLFSVFWGNKKMKRSTKLKVSIMLVDRCSKSDQKVFILQLNAKHSLPGKVFNELYGITDLPRGNAMRNSFKEHDKADRMFSSESSGHYSFPRHDTCSLSPCPFLLAKLNPFIL